MELFGIILGVSFFTFAAYLICTYFEGATLANASGLNLQIWTERFIVLVKMSCALTAICLLLWYILTKVVFQVQSSADWGKRTVWGFFLLVVTAGILLITNLYADNLNIKTDLFVNIIFILCFDIGGYWLTSIAVTPVKFKFAPLGSVIFRR